MGSAPLQTLSLLPGSTVLDVGCGSGASALLAAMQVGPSGHVIGIDLAERLLDIARAKSGAQKLNNVQFKRANMEVLDYPDKTFDAVICVFAIFFVPDMVKQLRELWRVIRPQGKLAITTWGPRMFEPGSGAWWSAVKAVRPDLFTGVNPWERVTTTEAVQRPLSDSGIEDPSVRAESGQQHLPSPEDWWTIVLGSGYRWTVEQMNSDEVARKAANLKTLRDNDTKFIETNVVYAVAEKR